MSEAIEGPVVVELASAHDHAGKAEAVAVEWGKLGVSSVRCMNLGIQCAGQRAVGYGRAFVVLGQAPLALAEGDERLRRFIIKDAPGAVVGDVLHQEFDTREALDEVKAWWKEIGVEYVTSTAMKPGRLVLDGLAPDAVMEAHPELMMHRIGCGETG